MAPRIFDPKTIQRIQQMHRAAQQQQQPGPKPRSRPLQISGGHQTTMQRIRNA